MKAKKALAATLAATMMLSLAACGSTGSTDDSSSSSDASTSSSDVTLTVAIWDTNQEPGLREIMDDFTAETGINVDIQITPWKDYWTMLEAATTGGNMPDVFWMHSQQIGTYSEYDDILLDLSDKIAESDIIDLSKFQSDIVELYGTEDGRQLGIPKDVDTAAVWYNKDMFDEAGIAYPTADWTWEDFYEIAKQLTKEDGSQYGLAMKPGSDQEGWYGTIYAYGGEVITDDKKSSGFDEEKTLEAMELVSKIIEDCMPPYQTLADNGTAELQEAGVVAMTFQGSWMVPELGTNEYLQEHIAIAPLPQGPEGAISMCNGLAWSASAQGAHTEEAWKLIEYLGSEEAQLKQAELGVTMSAYEGTSDAWVNSMEGYDLQPYLDMREDAILYPYSKNTQAWYQMILEKMVDAWGLEKPMSEVCLDIAASMNEKLAEE
jgi:multiple sugar transport system substrate-binding protein